MHYVSTRGEAGALGFEAAMLTGLARDGGLYVPETWPTLAPETIAGFAGRPYADVAETVMRPFVGDLPGFGDAVRAAYAGFGHAALAPLKQIASGHFLLELFHGPTLAFKDVAMQLIGHLFEASLARSDGRVTIVGATSGDTGSAAIEAFAGRARTDVFILYPDGRVSEVQRRQMTTPAAANVHAVAVEGTFDDCQARLKDMFNDHAFRDATGLAGVNSINWARVLAQVVYFFTAAVALGAPHRAVRFCVPTGNFGDIFAGYVAKRMGLPIERLVIATNRNDILHRTLQNGDHATEGVEPTLSPSMDIQVSSNFERLLFEVYDREPGAVRQLMGQLKGEGRFRLSQGALERLRADFASGRADDDETAATIAATLRETGELVCPHTACGIKVAQEQPESAAPTITLATAHPAKFPDAVERATGVRPQLPPRMGDLFKREERIHRVPNDLAALQRFVAHHRA